MFRGKLNLILSFVCDLRDAFCHAETSGLSGWEPNLVQQEDIVSMNILVENWIVWDGRPLRPLRRSDCIALFHLHPRPDEPHLSPYSHQGISCRKRSSPVSRGYNRRLKMDPQGTLLQQKGAMPQQQYGGQAQRTDSLSPLTPDVLLHHTLIRLRM